MLITKEQQEKLVENYIKEKHNQDECIGFIDGINAVLDLMTKIEQNKSRLGESIETHLKK